MKQGTFSLLKNYKLQMTIALLLMLVELVVELIQPLIMAKIIDDGILHEDLRIVLIWGSILLAASLFSFVAGIINSYYSAYVGNSFGYDLRKKMYKKVQSFSYFNTTRFPVSTLVTRMTNDVTQLQNVIFMGLRIMMRTPLLLIGAIIMSFFINVTLALIFLCVVPVIVALVLYVMSKGGKLFRLVQAKLDEVNNVLRESLAGIRVIKALQRSAHEFEKFVKANRELKSETVLAFRWIEISMPILLFVMNLGIMLILWIGSVSVANGSIQVGEVVAIINYATRITIAITMLSFISMVITRAKASSQRISEVLSLPEEQRPTAEHASAVSLQGEVEFRNVSFRYPNANIDTLHNISFHVKPRQTIVFLGSTGAGKSTLFHLLPKLLQKTAGDIYFDGISIDEIPSSVLRKHIGWVPQETLLFSGAIKDNIAWGNEDATMEEIIASAKDAQIHETIVSLPNGYDTVLGQKGINLSGGQKQRISIARALVRKPSILLLDDCTSALDLKTESLLLKALKTYSCTTFLITQKISAAMEADHIVLLDKGELIGQGDHSYLLRHNRLYQQIYASQFGKETRDVI